MSNSRPPFYKQTVEIIERIEWIGFPSTKNIKEIENLAARLEMLAPNFEQPIHQISIKRLCKTIDGIKKQLERDGDVPVSTYTKLNSQLVIFKENLLAA